MQIIIRRSTISRSAAYRLVCNLNHKAELDYKLKWNSSKQCIIYKTKSNNNPVPLVVCWEQRMKGRKRLAFFTLGWQWFIPLLMTKNKGKIGDQGEVRKKIKRNFNKHVKYFFLILRLQIPSQQKHIFFTACILRNKYSLN